MPVTTVLVLARVQNGPGAWEKGPLSRTIFS